MDLEAYEWKRRDLETILCINGPKLINDWPCATIAAHLRSTRSAHEIASVLHDIDAQRRRWLETRKD